MKKTLLLLVLLLAVSSIPVFSFGIGAAFGLDIAGGNVGPAAALLSFKLDAVPAVFGLGFAFRDNYFRLGATADWWAYHYQIVEILAFYVGPGIYADLGIVGNDSTLGVGIRIPVGLQAFVLEPLELFLELAPTFGLKDGRFPVLGMQGAFGFRFWF